MKLLAATALLGTLLMLFSRFFDGLGARHRLDLDGLATLEVPTSFHLDEGPEQQLPVARRLLRRPYVDFKAAPDRLTYYLPAHEQQTFGGEVVPVVLRITLYADDAPLPDAPDKSYFDHLVAEDFYHDGQHRPVYDRLAKVAEHLYYTAEPETIVGWFSKKERPMHHFVLTDAANHARLYLSAREDELTRDQAEKVLRDVQRSLRRDPAALTRYFAHAGRVVQQREAVEQANVEVNLRQFNQQLAAAGLPPLQPVARYAPGRYVDVGPYFYGINSLQEIFFAAYLGSAPLPLPKLPPYFSNNNGQGHYLPSFQQRAIWQRGVPAGHELLVRSSVSEPLWYPPEEVGRFQLPDLLRETAATVTQVQRTPGFVPATTHVPVRWELSPANEEEPTELGTAADYRDFRRMFGPVTGPRFQLSYLGLRTPEGQPAEAVFTLEIFPDGSPRYRRLTADAQYLAVDAARGGTLALAVLGRRYRARIEPPAQGHLTVEPE
ncbi:hypothetical protein Q5H93_06640 [Hymenobacter sp. ASUV-10]|uniref:Uncharacterized protein n=1 Tax=Hymenobacter aranciens TaxID=3063996 RepID=A0ABT9B9J8_9BACT|nr:hypothetical protein [Hymenobacter sp. ASUV-10]MDO7874404.1 hypothetical protein [Hymenobacter sp. ASUV-10]